MNKPAIGDLLSDVDEYEDLIDEKASGEREEMMSQNISRWCKKFPDKHVLVLTGCGHIEYFMKTFPQAEFPLVQ